MQILYSKSFSETYSKDLKFKSLFCLLIVAFPISLSFFKQGSSSSTMTFLYFGVLMKHQPPAGEKDTSTELK